MNGSPFADIARSGSRKSRVVKCDFTTREAKRPHAQEKGAKQSPGLGVIRSPGECFQARSAGSGLVRSHPLRGSGEDGCGFREAVLWIPRHPPDARPPAHRGHAESPPGSRGAFISPALRSAFMDGEGFGVSARVISRASPPCGIASSNERRTPSFSPISCATRTGARKRRRSFRADRPCGACGASFRAPAVSLIRRAARSPSSVPSGHLLPAGGE